MQKQANSTPQIVYVAKALEQLDQEDWFKK